MYKGGLIAWKSKKQATVSHATAESAIVALDHCVRDVQWERRGLATLGDSSIVGAPTQVWVDNKAAVDMSRHHATHDASKHIDAKYFYVRELVADKTVQVDHIPGTDNPADILTKPLPYDTFVKHRGALGVEDIAASGSVRNNADHPKEL
jgi:hypothetical protein